MAIRVDERVSSFFKRIEEASVEEQQEKCQEAIRILIEAIKSRGEEDGFMFLNETEGDNGEDEGFVQVNNPVAPTIEELREKVRLLKIHRVSLIQSNQPDKQDSLSRLDAYLPDLKAGNIEVIQNLPPVLQKSICFAAIHALVLEEEALEEELKFYKNEERSEALERKTKVEKVLKQLETYRENLESQSSTSSMDAMAQAATGIAADCHIS